MTGTIGSESELIQTYLAPLARRTPGALGLSDDCGVLVVPPGVELIVTTDAIAAGVHFLNDDAANDIAWKALAVNVSDLAAKGAVPLAYQMALSFPEAPHHDWLRGFASGLDEAQAAFGIGLLGGDTDRRPGPLTITITAFGYAAKGRMVLRSGARPGDVIFVSGTLGDGALGLQIRLQPAAAVNWHLTSSEAYDLGRRYLRPDPRLRLGPALLDYATAAMDISDGLMKDLSRMCGASHVGARLEIASIPLSQGACTVVTNDPSQMSRIVSGGDDYEILCTVLPENTDGFLSAAHACGIDVARIGTIVPGGGVCLYDADGQPVQLAGAGWDHF
ncbi:MAG: thiamine-phosphate kinase [Hyphomicrobium sp.]